MGLFDFLKKTYIEDYDELENLEDLVYDNEQNSSEEDVDREPMQIRELFDGFDKHVDSDSDFKEDVKPGFTVDSKSAGTETKESASDRARRTKEINRLDEEKYDHLLNSVQAQNLIKTVEKRAKEAEEKRKEAEAAAKQAEKNRLKLEQEAAEAFERKAKEDAERRRKEAEEAEERRLREAEMAKKQAAIRRAEEAERKAKEAEEKARKRKVEIEREAYEKAERRAAVSLLTMRESEEANMLFQAAEAEKRRKDETKQEGMPDAEHMAEPVESEKKRKSWKERRAERKAAADKMRAEIEEQRMLEEAAAIKEAYEKKKNKQERRPVVKRVEEDGSQVIDLPDVNRKPKDFEVVDTKKFGAGDIQLYVKSQCDIMEEAATFVESAKAEYEAVTEEYNDIQLIEEAPPEIRERIAHAAELIDTTAVDRRIFKSTDQKLSNSAFRRIEAMEGDYAKGIKFLHAQESFYDSVKQDMRMVEGERMSLRMEARTLVKRQVMIRSMAKTAIFCLAIVFVVFLVAMAIMSEDEANIALYIIVSLLAAILAVGMFAILKTTERQVLLCEIKLNKATALLNKIKIKYINAANTLDYEYNKYGVKSAYELENKYKLYLEMKEEQRKMMELTTALNEAELDLEEALKKLGLYDAKMWIGQVRALYNPKEMVEVRHELTVKRQKLRNQIEYNEGRIQEAKVNIKNITNSNPEYSDEAMRVIEMYERRHR